MTSARFVKLIFAKVEPPREWALSVSTGTCEALVNLKEKAMSACGNLSYRRIEEPAGDEHVQVIGPPGGVAAGAVLTTLANSAFP